MSNPHSSSLNNTNSSLLVLLVHHTQAQHLHPPPSQYSPALVTWHFKVDLCILEYLSYKLKNPGHKTITNQLTRGPVLADLVFRVFFRSSQVPIRISHTLIQPPRRMSLPSEPHRRSCLLRSSYFAVSLNGCMDIHSSIRPQDPANE